MILSENHFHFQMNQMNLVRAMILQVQIMFRPFFVRQLLNLSSYQIPAVILDYLVVVTVYIHHHCQQITAIKECFMFNRKRKLRIHSYLSIFNIFISIGYWLVLHTYSAFFFFLYKNERFFTLFEFLFSNQKKKKKKMGNAQLCRVPLDI